MAEAQPSQSGFELIVLDPSGRIRFSNAPASALMTEGDTVCRLRDRVSATDRSTRNALDRLINTTLSDAQADTAAVLRVVPLPRIGRLPLVAIGLPISRTRRHAGFELGAVILLRDPDQVHLPPRQIVRDMFGLTIAESDVALAIGAGSTLNEIALMRSCSINTVRTLFARVLQKSGCRRQAEVVRLLGSINDARAAAAGVASGMTIAARVAEDLTRHARSSYDTLLRLPLHAPPNQHATVVSRAFAAGADTGFHLHGSGHEIVCVLAGSLTMEYADRDVSKTGAGEAIYVPPGVIHRGLNAAAADALSLFHIGIGPAGSIDRRNV